MTLTAHRDFMLEILSKRIQKPQSFAMQEADHRYRNCDGYAQWAENTPVFIPGVLGGRG